MSDETFEKYFGPATYAFNYGNVHFIVFDDILYPDPRDGMGYWGGLTKRQFGFIKNDLKYIPKDKLIVFASHIPISEDEEEVAPNYDAFRDADRNKLFELLKDYPYTFSMSAHRHKQSQDFLTAKDGWLGEGMHHHFNVGATCGSRYTGQLNDKGVPISTMRDGTPKGYVFITFTDNKYVIDYKVADKPSDYHINIYAPKAVEKDKRTSAEIAANFFMGSKYDTLLYRIDDQEWRTMRYSEKFDPSYCFSIYQWDASETLLPGNRPSLPNVSKHLWVAPVPVNLEKGNHKIQVKVTDRYGRDFKAEKVYRIEVK